ncbi:hypothetical protein IQ07DRAFT_633957 [Pyrenochaeta sp. DS3sAY3a]|nr:hypothetical protein IQ07DRAFT_633957 [Pyrenochaeta sp. DS3sAY3a]
MADTRDIKIMRASIHEIMMQRKLRHKRIEDLKKELNEQSQEQLASSDHLREQLILCSKAECRSMTKMMYQKLPVELRDMIYQYLLTEDRLIPAGPHFHTRRYIPPFCGRPVNIVSSREWVSMGGSPGEILESRDNNPEMNGSSRMPRPDDDFIFLPDGRIKYDHTHRPPPDMITPSSHLLNSDYVEEGFLQEAEKFYYKTNSFSVCNVGCALWEFLGCQDPDFEQNFAARTLNMNAPIKHYPFDYVRTLQVRFKMDHSTCDALQNSTSGQAYEHERRFLRSQYESLTGLDWFLHEGASRELNIEFIIMTDFSGLGRFEDHDRRFLNSLQVVRNTIYTAIHDCERSKVRILHHNNVAWIFPRDYTAWFSLTKDQWEQEKAIHSNRASDDRGWITDFFLNARWPVLPADGGYPEAEMRDFLKERWGFRSIADTAPSYPIVEGRYWPRGIGPSISS